LLQKVYKDEQKLDPDINSKFHECHVSARSLQAIIQPCKLQTVNDRKLSVTSSIEMKYS